MPECAECKRLIKRNRQLNNQLISAKQWPQNRHCPITFSEYVEDTYQTYLVAQEKNQLEVAMHELSAMNPPPMNTMLEGQAREEAIMKRTERKGKTVTDVPPTTPGNFKKL